MPPPLPRRLHAAHGYSCHVSAWLMVADTCVQMLDYNVPGGKLNRGMAVLDVLRALKHPAVRHICLQHRNTVVSSLKQLHRVMRSACLAGAER